MADCPRMKRIRCLILLIVLFAGLIPFASGETLRSAPLNTGGSINGMVRVALSSLGQPSRLDITVQGDYSVSGAYSRSVPSGSSMSIAFSSQTGSLSLAFGGETLLMGSAFKLRRHSGSGEAGLKIAQGRAPANLYPADLYFSVQQSGSAYKMTVIAYVFIEDYLYGVLPYEMGNGSHIEALKAQAVAARTYTLRKMGGGSYDVVDTTSDQVYAGTPSGNANCRAAVDATRGIVMKNNGAYTATFYSTSNGGQTESAANAWGSSGYSYLGVRDDPYDLANPQSIAKSYEVPFNPDAMTPQLMALLLAKARSLTGRQDIALERVVNIVPHQPMYPEPSRLFTKLDFFVNLIQDGALATATLSFDIFTELEQPLALSINSGSNELWSVSRGDTGFVITARRHGHGIGMSQRGAMQMGAMGYTYDQIIAFYYSGCQRVSYSFTRSILSPYVPGAESGEETTVINPADIGQESAGKGLAGSDAPIYQQPDASSPVLAVMPEGGWADILTQQGTFFGVRFGELKGYVRKSTVSFSGTVPEGEVEATALMGHGTVVNTKSLNLRSGPSASASILTTIPGGTILPVFSVSGNYARVQFGLQGGYVSLDFIDMAGARPAIIFTGEPQTGIIRALDAGAVLRSRASLSSYAVKTLADGESVTVMAYNSSWAEVQSGITRGYLLSRNVELTGGQAMPVSDEPQAGEWFSTVSPPSGSLNMRSQPSLQAVVILVISKGEKVIVTSQGMEWSGIRYHGIPGYVMSEFLAGGGSPDTTLEPEGDEETRAEVLTPSGSLNLRETSSQMARVLKTIPRLAEVSVISRGAEWCRVEYMGIRGYVMTKFLRFMDAQPSLTPTPTPTPGPTPGPEEQGNVRAWVNTPSGSLNFRDQPQVPSRIMMTIPKGTQILVIQRGLTWSQVLWSGTTGYVQTGFLSFDESPGPTPTPPPGGGGSDETARVNTSSGSLNLRETASLTGRRLTSIPQNDYVQVIRRMGTWTQCAYMGQTGYVMSTFLAFVEQTASPQPSPNPEPAPENTGEDEVPGQDETPAAPTPSPTPPPDERRDPSLLLMPVPIVVTVQPENGTLNLRRGCSQDSAVILEMPSGDSLLVLERGDEWCRVVYEGREGYCMSRYLDLPAQ